MYSAERLYTQGDLDEAVEKANEDGVLYGSQETATAWREGFRAGYAAAVEDHERGEFIDPGEHLKRSA